MSAIERDCKKIRKRQTRAERNQLARHHQYQDVEKQKKNHFKSKKTSDHIQSHNPPPTFSLRSNKGVSMPCLIPKDLITATAGNLTQGRLTRPLAVFENARTSTWATRAPETEEKSKHVERESKRSFNVPDIVVSKGNVCNEENYVNKNPRNADNQNMEVDPSHLSSPTVSETSSKRNQMSENKSAKPSSYHSPASTKITVLSEISPVNKEEVFELEPPVRDIADIIMKELKSKFDKHFPKRDIDFENSCDLEKLLRQRSRENEMLQFHSISSVHVDKKPHSNSRAVNFAASTPSVCPPMRMQGGLRTEGCIPCSPSPMATPQGSERFTFLPQDSERFTSLPQGSDNFNSLHHGIHIDYSKSLMQAKPEFIATLVQDTEKEKVMTLKLNSGKAGEDIECNSQYTTVRCDELVEFEPGQELKSKLDKQCLMQLNSVFPHSATDEDKRRQSCSLQNDWQSGRTLPQWRRSARTLDFSQPNGFSFEKSTVPCSSRCPEQNMFTCSRFPHHKSHSTNSHHHHFHTGCTTSTCTRDTNILGSGPGPFGSPGAPYCVDRSLRHTIVNPAWSGRHTSTLRMVQSLAQSRFNFQEALNTACRLTDARQTKQMCCRGHFEHLPLDHPCCGGCKSLKSSYVCCHSPQVSSYSLSQPLIELQIHQADLQRQAKDFLDDLADQSPEESRNIFPIGSPDSSPVWMQSYLKDAGLEVATSSRV